MADPFFSVIIPTYNRRDYILNTLASIFAQTYTHFEIIVVDDASTDDTVTVLQPLADEKKITLICQAQNGERAKARNIGIKAAKGNFVTFIDSDDFMYPQNLAEAFEFQKNNPEYQIFHNRYELINAEKKVLYQYPAPSLANPMVKIVKGNFLSCIGTFIHQTVYQTTHFDEHPDIAGSEDYDFWLRVIGKCQKMGRIDRINSAMLHHAQRSVYDKEAMINKAEKRLAYFYQKVENHPEYQVYGKYKKYIHSTMLLFFASTMRELGEYEKLKEYLSRAKAINPKVVFTRPYLSNLWFALRH